MSLDKLREQKERQQAAIDKEVGDLVDLQTSLINKPNRSAKEDQFLGGYTAKIFELNTKRADLGAAYLKNLAKSLNIDQLIKKLDNISGGMEDEAKKMESGTQALKAAARILTLGSDAIDTLGGITGGDS